MATIQVRDVPEDTYEMLRKLARAEGKSLQSFMRDRMIALANQAARSEAIAKHAALLAENPPNISIKDILEALDAGRHE